MRTIQDIAWRELREERFWKGRELGLKGTNKAIDICLENLRKLNEKYGDNIWWSKQDRLRYGYYLEMAKRLSKSVKDVKGESNEGRN